MRFLLVLRALLTPGVRAAGHSVPAIRSLREVIKL
jgi:hypothetical protein